MWPSMKGNLFKQGGFSFLTLLRVLITKDNEAHIRITPVPSYGAHKSPNVWVSFRGLKLARDSLNRR